MTSTASTTNNQAMSAGLPLTKTRHTHLWLHQTIVMDTAPSSTPPNVFIQPSSPSLNLYKRSAINRIRKKSGEESQSQDIKVTRAVTERLSDLVIDTRVGNWIKRSNAAHETLAEEEQSGDEKATFSNGDALAAAPLASPTKRVTFLERVTGATTSLYVRSLDSYNGEKVETRKQTTPGRRVRKSKTLDAVELSIPEKPSSHRNQVVEFFSQIRTGPSAPRKSSSTASSGSLVPSPIAGSGRQRSFTLGFKTFANFRLPQQQEGRKTSRQSLRSFDGKEKRKRTQSYSFRAPSWLNAKSKPDQSSLLKQEMPTLRPIIRKRSISANNLNLLIMRQTSSEPEVLGSLNRSDNAYKEILSKFSCYDLMPQQSVVIGFDCRFTGMQALQALDKNEVRVVLLWDFASGGTVGVLTATDLLRLFVDHMPGIDVGDSENADQESACTCGNDVLGKPLVTSLYECPRSKKTKRTVTAVGLRTALSLLLGNQYHRLAVVNLKTGDVLYFLSKNALLHFLMHHMSTLPTPAVFRQTLDKLRLGTWRSEVSEADRKENEKQIVHTVMTESLAEVVQKFLTADISAVPIFGENQRLLDALMKYDVIYYLTSNAGKNIDLKTVTVEELVKNRREGLKHMITCPAETTLFIALERLVKTQSRRIYVTDSDGAFRAVVTITDLLSFLMA